MNTILVVEEVKGKLLRRQRSILQEVLTADEQRQLKEQGYLQIPSQLYPGRVYQIALGKPIEVREEGKPPVQLSTPLGHLSKEIALITIKYYLEGAEGLLLSNTLRLERKDKAQPEIPATAS